MAEPIAFGTVGSSTALNKNEDIIVVRNTSGATIADGSIVCYDLVTDDNGTSVVLPAAGNLEMVAGILMQELADDEYGRCMRRGNYDTARVLGHASLLKGTRLKIVAGQRYVTYDAAAVAAGSAPAAIVAREDWTTVSDGAKKVAIRL